MSQIVHPTKARLIETTVELMDTKLPSEIAVDEILEKSGISKGSLYHHFEDLTELLEAAQVSRYAQWVDRSVKMLTDLITSAKTIEEFRAGLMQVTTYTQSPEYKKTRYERARTIASSENSPRFERALAQEQDRLTDALEDLIHEAQAKKLWRGDVDPRAAAVFVQAYTLGKIVDDFAPNPMDAQKWNELITTILDRAFFYLID